MQMTCKVDLDDIYTDEEWSTTVGEVIRTEIKYVLRAVVKKELKKREKQIALITSSMSKRAIEELKKALGDK